MSIAILSGPCEPNKTAELYRSTKPQNLPIVLGTKVSNVVNQDDAQISQTELALQGSQTTLSQQQAQRTTDFTTAQAAADGVVAALASKGYAIKVPQPSPPPA